MKSPLLTTLALLASPSATTAFHAQGFRRGTILHSSPAASEVELELPTSPESSPSPLESEKAVPSTPLTKAPVPRKSEALPFMMAPAVLDGTLAADAGFDPVGFADCRENLLLYREAEIKHARLAMLAAAGWPLAELFQPQLSKSLNLPDMLTQNEQTPSVLNGGLGQPAVLLFLTIAFVGASVVEMATINAQYLNPQDFDNREKVFANKEASGQVPGIYGFDPLGLESFFGASEAGRKLMQTAEIKNGRLAMMAITGFAIQEAVFHQPVVKETPLFFTPIWQIVANLMTSPDIGAPYGQF